MIIPGDTGDVVLTRHMSPRLGTSGMPMRLPWGEGAMSTSGMPQAAAAFARGCALAAAASPLACVAAYAAPEVLTAAAALSAAALAALGSAVGVQLDDAPADAASCAVGAAVSFEHADSALALARRTAAAATVIACR
jgi:hypothetical protein